MSDGMGGLAEEIKNEIKAEKNDAPEDRWVSCSLVQGVPDLLMIDFWTLALVFFFLRTVIPVVRVELIYVESSQ